ncbi:hypothetical protein GCM10025880_53420 [Methylorubrum aminovorans]|nr:hypothetical protein GCM10025880_53420 [Methylorubrum aminovorans]
MGGNGFGGAVAGQQHAAVGERQGERALEPAGRGDVRAGGDVGDMVGEGGAETLMPEGLPSDLGQRHRRLPGDQGEQARGEA